MKEDFETTVVAHESVADMEVPVTAEAVPISREDAVHALNEQQESFQENIFDADARAREMGVEGSEADELIKSYKTITSEIAGKLRNVAAAGAIALGGGQAIANEAVSEKSLESQVAAFVAGSESAPAAPVATTAEKQPTAESGEAKEVPSTQTPELNPQGGNTTSTSEKAVAKESRQKLREKKTDEIMSDMVEALSETAPNTVGTGKVGGFIGKHGGFIAENIIPGAGIKRALTGKDAYGADLSKWERTIELGEAVLELASFGKSKVLKALGALFKTQQALSEYDEDKTASNAANVVGAIAGGIPGGRAVKNVAETVSIVTDPTVQKIGGPVIDLIKNSAGEAAVGSGKSPATTHGGQ